jgi:hypothetical protein
VARTADSVLFTRYPTAPHARALGRDVSPYANRHLQLERQSRLPPARSTVLVRKDVHGHIEIRYRDRLMHWTELAVTRGAHLAGAETACPGRPPTTRPER